MALAQDVGPHLDRLAGDPLQRIAAAVDARIDVLDEKARPGWIVGREFGQIRDRYCAMMGGSQGPGHVVTALARMDFGMN